MMFNLKEVWNPVDSHWSHDSQSHSLNRGKIVFIAAQAFRPSQSRVVICFSSSPSCSCRFRRLQRRVQWRVPSSSGGQTVCSWMRTQTDRSHTEGSAPSVNISQNRRNSFQWGAQWQHKVPQNKWPLWKYNTERYSTGTANGQVIFFITADLTHYQSTIWPWQVTYPNRANAKECTCYWE